MENPQQSNTPLLQWSSWVWNLSSINEPKTANYNRSKYIYLWYDLDVISYLFDIIIGNIKRITKN